MTLEITKALGYAESGADDDTEAVTKLLGYAETGADDDTLEIAKLLGYAFILLGDPLPSNRRRMSVAIHYTTVGRGRPTPIL